MKGPSYERTICRQLSLWLSEGVDDSWLWRSSQSGGRATTRAKKGKTTKGHCGDICATCRDAEFFTDLVTVEVKCGYNRSAFMADLLDRKKWPSGKARKATMLGMIEQAQAAAKRAGTPYYMLIHKRDCREALVYLPGRLLDALDVERSGDSVVILNEAVGEEVIAERLTDFIDSVDCYDIHKAAKKRRNQ